MKKTKKYRKSKIEKILFTITIFLIVLYPVVSVFAKSTLSKINYQVETAKEEISEETKNNQSLEMKINELASLENMETVAKEMGLSYTSNSIKTIE